MTEPEITKAEREELLATHARVTRPTRDYLPTDEADWKRLHDLALIPRLLRALDAAEANYERCAKASRGVLETRDILFREHEALKAKLAALVNERDALKAELARTSEVAAIAAKSLAETEEEIDAAESLAWDALGRPDGTHDESNVQRLCAAYGEAKAKLAALVGPIHMSCDINRQSTLCGVYFLPSVMRTPRRSNVTCGACLAIDDAALAAAKEPQP